ncbi:MAG TPA: threonine synthase [Bacteroidales bacterium]|nr:threonine synthase [Bacteroidales bacterium]
MVHNKFKYQCSTCGSEYDAEEIIYLCPLCSQHQQTGEPPKGVLKVLYDYQRLRSKKMDFRTLKINGFLDILPIESLASLPNLKIGDTPLYIFEKLSGAKVPFTLFLKDDSQNPTFSFKDRASALVSAFAKEKGLNTIVAASTGNAGSSLAGICAAQGQKAIIMVPETAPMAKLTQIMMYGATIVPLKGSYDDAFDLSVAATQEFGWYNRNTAYNPLTIEGKKTVAFELFEQLDHKTPDRIFVSVGDGVIIAGVFKGFEDLMKLGFIDKMPCIVAVQAKGSDNLVRNLSHEHFEAKASNTIADSISVDAPRNFHMARQFIKKYNGQGLTISDEEILNAASTLAKQTGIFTEPASAAAYAGMLQYLKEQKIDPDSTNVVMLTGSGLKDLKAIQEIVKISESVSPTIEKLKRHYNNFDVT